MDMTAADIARATGGTLVGAPGTTRITSVTIDSRTAGPGSLFVAIAGTRADGHDFAAQAVTAGAALALTSRPVDVPHIRVPDTVTALAALARAHLAALRSRRPAHLKVAGITGSVGKTTTKDLLARACAAMGPTVAAKGSFNNHLGLPLTILSATYDTQFLVLEMGANHRGEIAALAQVAPPDVGIVLGVAPAHVGEFGSLDAIAAAKAELPAALGAEAIAVLNLDDPVVAQMPTAAHVVTFGRHPAAIVRGLSQTADDAGHLTLDLTTPAGDIHLPTALVGTHHAANVLAATAGALALGATPQIIAEALTGVGPDSPHRMALTDLGGGVQLVDDAYNANPTSSAAALRFVAQLARDGRARVWAVLGEMRELGDTAAGAHRDLGALAAELGVDRLIVVGDGARGIAEGALEAGLAADAIDFFASVPEPWDFGAAGEGTVILVKGSNSTGLWRLADALAASAPGQEAPRC